RLVLGRVVTTVDAVNGAATLGREEVCAKQVAFADRLVLTKSDLAGATAPALLDRLQALNAAAPLIPAHHGRADPRRLFDAGLYDPRGKSLDARAWLGEEVRPSQHFHHRHDAEITTYALV